MLSWSKVRHVACPFKLKFCTIEKCIMSFENASLQTLYCTEQAHPDWSSNDLKRQKGRPERAFGKTDVQYLLQEVICM